MRKIIPIVEGHGELQAVPVLLRKLLYEHHKLYEVEVDKPIRRHRYDLATPEQLVRWVKAARHTPGCSAIVVIFDEDDDCTRELAPRLVEHARVAADGLPVYVVLAVREYESWLLASLESLKGQAGIVPDPACPENGPESVRDAKGWVSRNLASGRTYAPTVDQARLTAHLDPVLAYANSRSFRKLWHDVADLVSRLGGVPAAM